MVTNSLGADALHQPFLRSTRRVRFTFPRIWLPPCEHNFNRVNYDQSCFPISNSRPTEVKATTSPKLMEQNFAFGFRFSSPGKLRHNQILNVPMDNEPTPHEFPSGEAGARKVPFYNQQLFSLVKLPILFSLLPARLALGASLHFHSLTWGRLQLTLLTFFSWLSSISSSSISLLPL